MEKIGLRDKIKKAPQRPGVYLFKNQSGKILYVGKTLSLKDRLNSYLQKDIPPKTQQLISHMAKVSLIETGTNLEAILLEAKLIKLHQPDYNVILRDDKSFLYIFISTGEIFPKVFLIRKPKRSLLLSGSSRIILDGIKGEFFGPFPSARTAKKVMKMLRKIYPFCQQRRLGNRPCFYSHIGLCQPCPSYIVRLSEPLFSQLKRTYRHQIFTLKRIINGEVASVRRSLEKQMHTFNKAQDYEQAALVRDQIYQLDYVCQMRDKTNVFLENSNFYQEEQLRAVDELRTFLANYFPELPKLHRIEGYDISTLSGINSVGAQIVFIDGLPEKSLYRKYKISFDGISNDTAMLTEVISRRLKHNEWDLPNLIIVDGGKPQVKVIVQLLNVTGYSIPVIGLAKRLEHIILWVNDQFIELQPSRASPVLLLLQQIRDETHRFAISFQRHRRLLTKSA